MFSEPPPQIVYLPHSLPAALEHGVVVRILRGEPGPTRVVIRRRGELVVARKVQIRGERTTTVLKLGPAAREVLRGGGRVVHLRLSAAGVSRPMVLYRG